MNFIKIITIFNWIVIGLLTYLVAAETIFPAKGGDAAGRGMGQAIYYLSIVALVVLLILNFLPYKATKYTAFALVLIPILYVQIAPYWRDLQRGMQSRRDAAKPIFEDKERDQIARAIDNGDPEKLKKYLQTTPVAKLNEDGDLLAYAINATNSTAYKPTEKIECIRILFQAGARLDSIQGEEVPIYFSVAANGNATLLRILLEQGADANAVQYYSKQPIIFEAVSSYQQPEATVQALLDFGANPNSSAIIDDEQGAVSPLFMAAESERWGICAALLAKGANPDFKAKNGQSFRAFIAAANEPFPRDGYSTQADFDRVKKLLK